MEDDLNFFTNGRQPQFFENGRQNQYCGKSKTTSIFSPKEGDLYYLENERRPQLFGKPQPQPQSLVTIPDYFDDWSTFVLTACSNDKENKSALLKCSAWEGPGPGIISLF